MRGVAHDAVALDGNDFVFAQRVQQIEGKRRGIAGVIDAHAACAGFFERLGQMPRRLAMRFRRAHHANFALEFLAKSAAPRS